MHRLAVRRLSVNAFPKRPGANFIPLTPLAFIDRARHVFADGPAVVDSVEIKQWNDAAVLAPSSGEEPASPRHRAGVASMAWRTTR